MILQTEDNHTPNAVLGFLYRSMPRHSTDSYFPRGRHNVLETQYPYPGVLIGAPKSLSAPLYLRSSYFVAVPLHRA